MLQSDGSNDEEYVQLQEKIVSRESLRLARLKSWHPQEIAENPQLTFKVFFTATDLDLPPKLQVETLSALERSLQTGVFVDTRFCVFSRRLRLGTVGHPLALFASSTVLQATLSYFRTRQYLSGTSPPDSPIVDVGLDFVWEEAFTDKYDYESDNDLGDEEDPASPADETQTSATMHEPASNIEGRPNAKVTQWRKTEKVLPLAHFRSMGRTILVADTAFKTWQTLILYLYSGNVEFLPLKSQKSSIISKPIRLTVIACSPKSMYRLADKLGHHDLKTLALKSIRDGLSEQNILDEAFSSFTSRYPEIMEMEVNVLCRHCRSPGVLDAFPSKVERVAKPIRLLF